MKTFFIAILFGLVALGFYTIGIGDISSGFHGDEAVLSLHSLKMLENKTISPFGVGAHNHPQASFLPQVISFALFGKSVFAARFPTAVMSALGVIIFYLMTHTLFNPRVSFFATVLFATSHLWIALSRLALNNTQIVPFGLLTIWLLVLSIRTGKLRYFSALGGLSAMMFYLYAGFRIFPVIVILILLFQLFLSSQKKRLIIGILLAVVTFFIIGLPQLLFFANNQRAFTDRTENIFVLGNSGESRQWRENIYREEKTASILVNQAKKTFFFWQTHDTSGQYGYPNAILPPTVMALVLLGIVLSIRFARNVSFAVLPIWFFLTLIIGNMLTIDPFFLPRATGALPVLYLFVGIALDKIVSLVNRRSRPFARIILLISILFVLVVSIVNLKIYFIDSERNMYGDPNKYTAVKIVQYLESVPPTYTAIFLTQPNLHADYPPIQFFHPAQTLIDRENPSAYTIPEVKQTIFILYPNYEQKVNDLVSVNPSGTLHTEYDRMNRKQIIFYQVD